MITITFSDNTIKKHKEGITPLEIVQDISEDFAKKVLAAKVNDELWDLTRPLKADAVIEFFTWEDEIGKSVFWHSSAHLMAEAIEFFYPGTKFAIGPSIEQGFYYDIDLKDRIITTEDFERIENKMKKLALQKNKFIRCNVTKEESLTYFKEKDDEYKIELIQELPENEISLYTSGNFIDLCRGPHLPDTGYIKAVKLLNVAGAYWRGDINKKQLTRIYGISFPTQEELKEYLHLIEEAKKRDHRKIGKDLDLFMFSQNVGPGLPLWLPKGTALRERLESFLKKVQKRAGYQQVITPHIGSKQLYVTSGHFEKYRESSFQPINTPIEGEQFMLKPMNCPHHCEIYKNEPRSYRDLPIRLAEFGTVYRYEQSGELQGLTRVRGFTQDDAHIFCMPEQVKQEFINVIDIVLYIFKVLDFKDYSSQISLRDKKNKDKYIGTEENWQKSEHAIIEAAEERRLKTVIKYGEAVFYGPKLDFMVKDALGRKWQLGTIQIDYNLPDRFELEYIGSDNQKHRPVMIHRAPFGSMERFVAILIEHSGGKFPLWLAPEQCIILSISEKFNDYGKNICELLNNSEIRTIIDERNEKIGKKIREAELSKIPYMLIIGEKEENNKTISVRKHGQGDLGSYTVQQFIQLIQDEIKLPEY